MEVTPCLQDGVLFSKMTSHQSCTLMDNSFVDFGTVVRLNTYNSSKALFSVGDSTQQENLGKIQTED